MYYSWGNISLVTSSWLCTGGKLERLVKNGYAVAMNAEGQKSMVVLVGCSVVL